MHQERALQLLDAHYQAMPPVAAMQLRIADYDGSQLRLHAPLAPHLNDKGCAFGGSLVSLMTLAGWGLVWLRVHEAGLDADIFIADSAVRYLAPLYADLDASAKLADADQWDACIAALRQHGRGRIGVEATVALPQTSLPSQPNPGNAVAAHSTARYVAIGKR